MSENPEKEKRKKQKKNQNKSGPPQQILDNYEQQKQRYLADGYEERQETISIVKANVMAFVTAGPFVILGILLWIVIGKTDTGTFSASNVMLFSGLFMLCIFIHELLHGIGWVIWTKHGWKKSIYLGVMREYLTPYCHCKEPLTPRQYLCGGLMPFLVLGAGFYVIAAATGSGLFLMLSLCNILCAGGDTTIACMLMKYLGRQDCYILDHPTDCGFVAFGAK